MSLLRWQVDTSPTGPGVLAAASALMLAEWPAPSLRYDVDLLGWQLGRWGGQGAVILTGWVDDRCMAFAGITPRPAAMGAWQGWLGIKSFMTVATAMRGRGVGRELRRRIVHEAATRGLPLLRFGEGGAQVDDTLTADYAAAGMTIRRTGECTAAAAAAAAGTEPQGVVASGRVIPGGAHLLLPGEDAAADAHYAADPRGRQPFAVTDASGTSLVSAWAVRAVLRTRDAVTTNVQLERLAVADAATADDVRRLVTAAAAWGYAGGRGMVSVPSCGDAPWATLSAAGFRRMPSRYSAWVAATDPAHPILQATGTRFEIV